MSTAENKPFDSLLEIRSDGARPANDVEPAAGRPKRRLTSAQREFVRWLVRKELQAWMEQR